MRKVISLALFFFTAMMGCSNAEEKITPEVPIKVEQKIEAEEYLRIVTSNKLLYYMVKDIVKDRHDVDYMMSAEEDQWSFMFSKDSIENISKKDVFIYFGAGFEPWADEFVDTVNKDRVTITNSTRGVRLLTLNEPRIYGNSELRNNPYFWFDPNDYKIVLSNIKTAIQEKDPKKRDIYEDNFKEAIKVLDEIDNKLLEDVDQYKEYSFVTVNDDFDYFFNHIDINPLKLSNGEDVIKFEEKLKDETDIEKQVILLYDDELTLSVSSYKDLLNNVRVRKIKVKKYSTDKSIVEMLRENYDIIREQLIVPE